jgi:uncharacterized membrane protein YsdA (DUF1294 family)/cold shock CspA family protein
MHEALPKAEWTARIAEWKTDKGYGWLQWGDKRVFLHRRDFSGIKQTPEVGEEVGFVLGQDAQGRPCAKNAVPTRGYGAGFPSLLLLAALLVMPAIALERVAIEGWKIMSYVLGISLITYTVYASDKHRARTKAWRIPEAHLHLLELLGGWPGAWLAQRRLRHKCSKSNYQFVFWLVILTHQFIAFDSLQEWSYFRANDQAGRRDDEASAQVAVPLSRPAPRMTATVRREGRVKP